MGLAAAVVYFFHNWGTTQTYLDRDKHRLKRMVFITEDTGQQNIVNRFILSILFLVYQELFGIKRKLQSEYYWLSCIVQSIVRPTLTEGKLLFYRLRNFWNVTD